MRRTMNLGRARAAVYSPILAAVLLILAGCTFANPPRDSHTLLMKLDAEPANLNPILATDAYESAVNRFVTEGLIDLDWDTLEYRPQLAERWTVSDNGLRLRFYLKKGVLWSDGVEFTADDVVFSFNTIKSPKVASAQLKVYFMEVKQARRVDRYTVDFICTSRNFMLLLNCGTMPLVPKHIFDDGRDFNTHPRNRHPLGTGPYKFVRWDTGKCILVEVNEKYRGPRPEIRNVEYILVSEQSVALQMLRKGELDVMSLRAIQWARQTSSDKFNRDFYKLKYYLSQYSYIGWNERRDFFKDRRVRRALTQLINRKAILDKLLFGEGRIATGPFFFRSKSCDPGIRPWPYDPAAARALLAQAGWRDSDNDGFLDRNGKKFSFTLTVSSGSKFAERLASIMKEDFEKSGIELKVNRYEWAVFLNKVSNHDFDAVPLGWSNPSFQDDPYQVWHSSQRKGGSNYVNFSNSEADRIMEKARTEFDDDARAAMYRRFHQILHDEQPYTFLYNTPELVAVSRRFTNVKVHVRGLNFTEWKVADR